jgi:hypothetical protein
VKAKRPPEFVADLLDHLRTSVTRGASKSWIFASSPRVSSSALHHRWENDEQNRQQLLPGTFWP